MPEDYHQAVERAERALLNEEWDYALEEFDKVISQNPALPPAEEAELYNGRGAALLKTGRYEEAGAALEKALSLNHTLASAHFNLALLNEATGDFDNALTAYNRSIYLEPQDAELYFRRGGIYFIREEFEKTVEDNTRAIELHTGSEAVTGPYIARGLALYRLERFDEALQDYTHALEVDPRGAADAYFYRALVYLDTEQALPARADLQAFLLMTADPDGELGHQAREIIEVLDTLE
jgi:tetratricopeptide (TPR) repeat protein